MKVKCLKNTKNGLRLDEILLIKDKEYDTFIDKNGHLLVRCEMGFNISLSCGNNREYWDKDVYFNKNFLIVKE